MTKAALRFVFPPEPSKWLFSVSVLGGLDVHNHEAVTETTEARWKLAGVPIANIALPWEPSPGMPAILAMLDSSDLNRNFFGFNSSRVLPWK